MRVIGIPQFPLNSGDWVSVEATIINPGGLNMPSPKGTGRQASVCALSENCTTFHKAEKRIRVLPWRPMTHSGFFLQAGWGDMSDHTIVPSRCAVHGAKNSLKDY